jgi:hypothetical protein
MNVYAVMVGGDMNKGYAMLELPIPAERLELGNDALFADFKKGAVAMLPKSKVTGETKITLGKHPGREWTIAADQVTSKVRSYIVGDKALSLSATNVSEKDAKKFFDSLKLTGADGAASKPRPGGEAVTPRPLPQPAKP